VSTRYLQFRGEGSTGLSNARMGLDIGVGLAQLTQRTLVMYDVKPLWRGSHPLLADGNDRAATILDLFEVPVPTVQEAQLAEIGDKTVRELEWPDLYTSVFHHPAAGPVEDPRFAAFRNGRRAVVSLSADDDAAPVLRFAKRSLSLYSYFFYLPENLRTELRQTMARVRPRRPYRELSEELCKSFGNFNAVHIRRGDFMNVYYKGVSLTPQMIVENLSSIMPPNEPLLICTDASTDTEFFQPILDAYPEAILLDQYMLGDSRWREALRSLPCNGDAALALICQTVAGHAHVFAGSLLSTYTAMIHRTRGLRTGDDPFFFVFNPFEGKVPFLDCEFLEMTNGLFSWNRFPYRESEGEVYSWFREWPEAFR
jgi:hypothetical protein